MKAISGQMKFTDWLGSMAEKVEMNTAPVEQLPEVQTKEVAPDGKFDPKCAACANWHFNTAAPATCPNIDCVAPEYKFFVGMTDLHKKVASDVASHWSEPRSCEQCDVCFGSLVCFERRGYLYLRDKREWLRDRDGKPHISPGNIICHKLQKKDGEHENQ